MGGYRREDGRGLQRGDGRGLRRGYGRGLRRGDVRGFRRGDDPWEMVERRWVRVSKEDWKRSTVLHGDGR